MSDVTISPGASPRREHNPKITAQAIARVMYGLYKKGQRDMSIAEIACGVLKIPVAPYPYDKPDEMSMEDYEAVNLRTTQASNNLYKAYGYQAVPFNSRYPDYLEEGPLTEDQAYSCLPVPSNGKVGVHFSTDQERDLLVKVYSRRRMARAMGNLMSGRDKMKNARRHKLLTKEDFAELQDELRLTYGNAISITFNGDTDNGDSGFIDS